MIMTSAIGPLSHLYMWVGIAVPALCAVAAHAMDKLVPSLSLIPLHFDGRCYNVIVGPGQLADTGQRRTWADGLDPL